MKPGESGKVKLKRVMFSSISSYLFSFAVVFVFLRSASLLLGAALDASSMFHSFHQFGKVLRQIHESLDGEYFNTNENRKFEFEFVRLFVCCLF